MVDRDRLFKELLKTFFLEFVDLFYPKVAIAIDPKSIRFLAEDMPGINQPPEEKGTEEFPSKFQEDPLYSSSNVLVQVKMRGQDACVWVHLVNCAEDDVPSDIRLDRRIFHIFAHLDAKYNQPIYPIVLLASESTQPIETNSYRVDFIDRRVLDFNFVAIQLYRLNWRDFLQRRNPVAAALMPAMKVQPVDRPVVKAECLRLLTNLRLESKHVQVISPFIDTYLSLNAAEEQVLQTELERMGLLEREQITSLLTNSKQANLKQGAEREALSLVFRLLNRRIGSINDHLEAQVRDLPVNKVEDLGEALLDFNTKEDLQEWLGRN